MVLVKNLNLLIFFYKESIAVYLHVSFLFQYNDKC